MNIKSLLSDDDAVSPVIGVILMVAITVILAAVIASFVLGLGNQADEVQPNSNFEFDYENASSSSVGDSLTITLTDGDSIESNNLYLRGDADSLGTGIDQAWTGSGSGPIGSGTGTGGFTPGTTSEVTSGQGIELTTAGSGSLSSYDLSVVWESADDSATLASDSGPDA